MFAAVSSSDNDRARADLMWSVRSGQYIGTEPACVNLAIRGKYSVDCNFCPNQNEQPKYNLNLVSQIMLGFRGGMKEMYNV